MALWILSVFFDSVRLRSVCSSRLHFQFHSVASRSLTLLMIQYCRLQLSDRLVHLMGRNRIFILMFSGAIWTFTWRSLLDDTQLLLKCQDDALSLLTLVHFCGFSVSCKSVKISKLIFLFNVIVMKTQTDSIYFLNSQQVFVIVLNWKIIY